MILKLAVAVRLGGYVVERGSPYGDGLSRLLAGLLSDLILLRQAEARRRELLAGGAAEGPKPAG